jgi:hypothetical protein
MREPERLKRVTFVRLQQRNVNWIALRSTVAAETPRQGHDECNGDLSPVIVPGYACPMHKPAGLVLAVILLIASIHAQSQGKLTADCHVVSTNTASQISEFKETSQHSLAPSSRFRVSCTISSDAQYEGEVLIWTSVDFIVAPATEDFAAKNNAQKASDVSWGQITEMSDLRAATMSLKRKETRNVVLQEYDLRPVLAAFPFLPNESDNLWPWLMALHIHVQGRDGRELASTQNLVALRPQRVRFR